MYVWVCHLHYLVAGYNNKKRISGELYEDDRMSKRWREQKHPLNTWNGDWRLTGSYTATSTHFMESYIVHTHTHTFTHTHPLSHQVEQINSRLKSTGWSGRRRDHFSSYLLTLKGFFYRDKYSFHLAQQRQHKRDRERREGGRRKRKIIKINTTTSKNNRRPNIVSCQM